MNPFDQHALEYDRWFDENANVYQSEIMALQRVMPVEGIGIEIGVGTGRFAVPFGIHIGVEPSENMAEIARKRGITVVKAFAETLPFHNNSFDFVLINTVLCFVNDVSKTISEAHRIIKPQGTLIIGMIDKDSALGIKYQQIKESDKYYKYANFRSVKEVSAQLVLCGFNDLVYWQTLISEDCSQIEQPSKDYGKGGFVVIKAI